MHSRFVPVSCQRASERRESRAATTLDLSCEVSATVSWQGLATYKGGVLLVSHDQHLISAVRTAKRQARTASERICSCLSAMCTRASRARRSLPRARRSQVVDELWAVSPDGCIKPFHGTFEDYKTLLKNGQV